MDDVGRIQLPEQERVIHLPDVVNDTMSQTIGWKHHTSLSGNP